MSIDQQRALVLALGLPEASDGVLDAWREAWEERAAIMEYDGGMVRRDAERLAEECVRREANLTRGDNSC